MCCKVLGVDYPGALTKPPDTACPHCKAGRGCAIYDQRPSPCRKFICQWLLDVSLDERWHPARSHIVITPPMLGDGFAFEVDRDRPDCWLQSPYFEGISSAAINNPGTGVRIGKRWLAIFPAEAAKHPERIRLTWRSLQLRVKPHPVGRHLKTLDGQEFVWMEMDDPADAMSEAWRFDDIVANFGDQMDDEQLA
jgi:hypothetical protein